MDVNKLLVLSNFMDDEVVFCFLLKVYYCWKEISGVNEGLFIKEMICDFYKVEREL